MTAIPARLPNTATAEAPAVLMGYQQRWVADKSPLKVIEKSRRTGLTWGEAADDVLTAASNRSAGGQNVYYIAYNQERRASGKTTTPTRTSRPSRSASRPRAFASSRSPAAHPTCAAARARS
ncbi:hypothetical protein ACWJKU_07090 [Methylocaldum sp. MU1018]